MTDHAENNYDEIGLEMVYGHGKIFQTNFRHIQRCVF